MQDHGEWRQLLFSPTAGCHMLSAWLFCLLLNQLPSPRKWSLKQEIWATDNFAPPLRVAVFYTMTIPEVLSITTPSVLEQVISEERAQVERREIIGSNIFETTWTACFHILIYTWGGGRREGISSKTVPTNRSLVQPHSLPTPLLAFKCWAKVALCWLDPKNTNFLLPRISPWTLWQLPHEGLWASLPIHFLTGNRNLFLQDWKNRAEENTEVSEESFNSFNYRYLCWEKDWSSVS